VGEGTNSPILGALLACVAASVVLVALGLWLRRSGRLTTSRAALLWSILSIAPLFGAGLLMFTKHTAEQVTGETRSGVNRTPIH
jgi:hypothetical protein